MRGVALGTTAIGLAVFAFATTDAYAEDASEPITLAYDAPTPCPDADTFFHEISARTTRVRATRANENARVLRVVVTDDGGAFVARLSVEDAGSASRAREVRGATCGEVVEALGLIAALTLDPKASTSPIRATAPTTPSNDTGDSAGEADAGGIERTLAPPPPEAGAPRLPVEASGTHFAAGVQVEGAAIADVVGSGRVFGEVELGERNEAVFVPSIRLAFARSLDVERAPATGRASLSWTQGGLDVCPLRFPIVDSGALQFRPCGAISAGVLTAASTQVEGARSRSRPWAATYVYARLSWRIAGLVVLDAEGGLVVPLTREEFFFEPNVHVYQTPLLALFGRMGASVRFP